MLLKDKHFLQINNRKLPFRLRAIGVYGWAILSMEGKYPYFLLLFAFSLSLAMHAPHLQKDLMSVHVWRQTQTQANIDNFFEEDMNILNPRRDNRGSGDGVFRMEFPLMQWSIAASYSVFGQKIVVTRLWMFFIGVFGISGFFLLIKEWTENAWLAALGAWAFCFSPCFYYYTISPLPDNFALALGIWGLLFTLKWRNQRSIKWAAASGLTLAVAALCKLPFILYFVVPFAFWLLSKSQHQTPRWKSFFAFFSFIALPIVWYALVIGTWQGNGVIKGILDNQTPISKLLFYVWANTISILPESLLNYASLPFFLLGLYVLLKKALFKELKIIPFTLLGFACIAYFFFELNMIADVHDYYLFPFMPLLFLIVAFGIKETLKRKKEMVYLCIALMPILAFVRMNGRWTGRHNGLNEDVMNFKTELQKAVPQDALCVVGNDNSESILFYYFDKKGWAFANDNLELNLLQTWIKEGAEYLYTDSKIVEDKVSACLDSLIMEKGSVRVFKLKSND